MLKCFDPLAGRKSSNGILLGFSEVFRKFYAIELYFKVAKLFGRIYSHTLEGTNNSLEVFLPGRGLETFPGRY